MGNTLKELMTFNLLKMRCYVMKANQTYCFYNIKGLANQDRVSFIMGISLEL